MTQPVDLVDQSIQNLVVEKPVIQPSVDPQLDAAVIGLELGTIPVEVVADSTAAIPLSNP